MAMSESMKFTLDKFFAEKTIQDIDRNSFLMCNLTDPVQKINISLVFKRDYNGDSNSFDDLIIKDKGVVFIFPGYWISIPKDLSMAYFEFVINDFYEKHADVWTNSKATAQTACPIQI